MWPFNRSDEELRALRAEVRRLAANATTATSLREQLASGISGSNDNADTLHNIYSDFGYPLSLTFSHFWNMYRRFGIARRVVDLPPQITWMNTPEIEGAFESQFEALAERLNLWQRMAGLDKRQRVGRYAGLFMRVRDGKRPDQPIDGKMPGEGALAQVVPLYEGQLEVLETVTDPTDERYGLPAMYQYKSNGVGSRNENAASNLSIHPDRVVVVAEGADDGSIYGIPALEACYNSLMDLRKIIGAGGEGFYRNAAQSLLFTLKDVASAKDNTAVLNEFNDKLDDFTRNRHRRALWTPGMDATVLQAALANPKEFAAIAVNDIAAASGVPATILIGQQTGRLASEQDGRSFLSMGNARREGYATEQLMAFVDWCQRFGILPEGDYEFEWPDLLTLSDAERLDNAAKMSKINAEQFTGGGGLPFTSEELREAAGYEAEEMPEAEDDGELDDAE